MSDPRPAPASNYSYPTVIALLALGLLFGSSFLSRFFPSATDKLLGHPAPDFSLAVVQNGDAGSRMRLSDLRGHAVILDFWASWCGPCQMTAPVLDRMARRDQDKGLVVVGINTSDEPGNGAAFARKKGLSYPIVFDEANQVASEYGVESLPTLVVINKQGDVVAVRSGAEDSAELDRLVAKAE